MNPEDMINNIAASMAMVDFLDSTKRGLIEHGWAVESAERAATQMMCTMLAAQITGGAQ